MGVWQKEKINTELGTEIASMPVIISASRATDIPAFYSRWMIERLRRGYAVKYNPFSGKREVVSFNKVRIIVFWSKYPAPMEKYLDELDNRGLNYYFLYTLNNYPEYEPFVPSLDKRIEVFRRMSERLGAWRVLWRYDPLIVSDKISVDELLSRVAEVGEQLKGYTKRLIFSFVDLSYRKVQRSLARCGHNFFELDESIQRQVVEMLKEKTDKWGMELRSCASRIDFSRQGVVPGKCIDDELMVRLFSEDKELMEFLGYKGEGVYVSSKRLKDKGQRSACRCIYSKDIGRYNTCPFGCIYCYANSSVEKARELLEKHNYLDESL